MVADPTDGVCNLVLFDFAKQKSLYVIDVKARTRVAHVFLLLSRVIISFCVSNEDATVNCVVDRVKVLLINVYSLPYAQSFDYVAKLVLLCCLTFEDPDSVLRDLDKVFFLICLIGSTGKERVNQSTIQALIVLITDCCSSLVLKHNILNLSLLDFAFHKAAKRLDNSLIWSKVLVVC